MNLLKKVIESTGEIFLEVPQDVELEKPIYLDGAATKKINFTLGDRSKGTVVVVHSVDSVSEISLGASARLHWITRQKAEKDPQAVVIRAHLSRYAHLESIALTHGTGETRHDISVNFSGELGFASLKGLTLLKEGGRATHAAVANHIHGHCKSEQFYKSILGDRAKSQFSSLVHVHPGAQKSDSRQLSKNLLLSDLAQAIAKPELKILADDVTCAHGATVGQLEQEELFYLRSRGLSQNQAKLLLIKGFAEEILQGIPDEELREQFHRIAHQELEEMLKT